MSLKDFCNNYYPKSYNRQIFDDTELEPTLGLFIYNCYRSIRSIEVVYKLRMLLQKIFRKNHISDDQLWNLDATLAKKVLPLLKAYKEYDRNGYPNRYSNYESNAWASKEEYDKAVEEGKMVGGEMEAWNKDLDEMIFSMEYIIHGERPDGDKFWKKYYGKNPYEKTPENAYPVIHYKMPGQDKGTGLTFSESDVPPEATIISKMTNHSNKEILNAAEIRCGKGCEMLGKMWRSLWD